MVNRVSPNLAVSNSIRPRWQRRRSPTQHAADHSTQNLRQILRRTGSNLPCILPAKVRPDRCREPDPPAFCVASSAMFFIVRALFWIGVVLFLLPATSQPRIELARSGISFSSVASLPSRGAQDAAVFCLRQPDSCSQGMAAAARFGARLDNSVKAAGVLAAAPVQDSPAKLVVSYPFRRRGPRGGTRPPADGSGRHPGSGQFAGPMTPRLPARPAGRAPRTASPGLDSRRAS